MGTPFLHFLSKSFYIRMTALMLTVSIPPLILLSYISVSVSKTTVEKQVNRVNEQLVNQVKDRLELTMDRLQELTSQYSQLPSIQRTLLPPSGFYDEVMQKRELISILNTADAVIGNVEGLQVYAPVIGQVISSEGTPYPIDESLYKSLIDRFMHSGKSSMFMDKETDPSSDLLQNSTFFARRVPFELYQEVQGILLISMNNKIFRSLIDNIELGPRGSISLLTPGGLTIATTSKLPKEQDDARIKKILERWRELNKINQFTLDSSIISVKQTSTCDKWIVVSEIPSDELVQSTGIIRKTVMYFLALLSALGIFSIIGFGYYLYRPLQAVKKAGGRHQKRSVQRADHSSCQQ